MEMSRWLWLKPNRCSFGLNDDAEEELQQESYKITRKSNTILTVLYIIGYIITALIYKNYLGMTGFFGGYVYICCLHMVGQRR